jgi:hypothetical protein
MFRTRMIGASGLVAAALVGLVGFAACGGDKSDPVDSGTGGQDSGSGGSTGDTGGSAGSPSQGGASAGYECTYTPVPSADITDFSVWDGGNWGDSTCCLTGGSFTYGETGDELSLDVAAEVLNVTGTVGANGYAGFGFWFGPCTDASAYSGVTFNIGGSSGETQIIFQVQTSRNYPIDDANSKGECVGSWGDPCASNEVEITVPDGGGVVQVAWAELTGGLPEAIDATELLGIQWQFNCGDAACDVAVTLDDVAFY